MRNYSDFLSFFLPGVYTYLIMKTRYFFLFLIVFLTACAGPQNAGLPTPTQISLPAPDQPEPAADNPVSTGCQPDASLLENLRTALPYQQAVVTPISYGDENTLLVWFASPELSEIPVQQMEDAAITQAVLAANTLLDTSVCVAEYSSLVFNVVDSSYQLWFTGSVRVADIPNLALDDGTGGGTENESEGAGRGPVAPAPAGKDSCTWAEAASQLTKNIRTTENQAVFYYTREAGVSTVYAHWQASSPPTADEVLATLTTIAPEIKCLNPPTNGLSATITGPDGYIQATAYLPLNKNGKPQENKFSFTPLQ